MSKEQETRVTVAVFLAEQLSRRAVAVTRTETAQSGGCRQGLWLHETESLGPMEPQHKTSFITLIHLPLSLQHF